MAVSVGPQQASEDHSHALAMGAARGLLVKADGNGRSREVAKILRPSSMSETARMDHGQAGRSTKTQSDRPDAAALTVAAGHLRVGRSSVDGGQRAR